jgi:hypothetical protein
MDIATTEPDLSKRSSSAAVISLSAIHAFGALVFTAYEQYHMPVLQTEIIELMSIRSDETFLFQCDRRRGALMQFLAS